MSRTFRFYLRLFTAAHVILPALILLFAAGPLFFNDYSITFYLQRRALLFFGGSWNLWGYDPSYAAGFPLNFTWNNSQDLQLLTVLLNPMPVYTVLRLTLYMYIASAPLFFWFALGNFGLKDARRTAAVVMLTVYWWTGLPVLLAHIGMPSTIMVFQVCFLAISFYYRYLIEDDAATLPWLYVLSPLCFMAHKTAVVVLGLPVAVMLMCCLRGMTARRAAHLVLIAAAVLALNSYWLVPLMHLLKYKITIPEAAHWVDTDPLRIFRDYFTLSKTAGNMHLDPGVNAFMKTMLIHNTLLRDFLLAFGVYGAVVWGRNGLRRRTVFFISLTVALLALIYFGSFWYFTAQFNPIRYIVILDYMLAAPAAVGAGAAWTALAARASGAKRISLRRAATVAAAALFAAVFLLAGVLYYHFINESAAGPDKNMRILADALDYNKTARGRILLEDSGWNDRDGLPPKYGHGHFPAMLADLTGNEFIGGPYPYVFLAHSHAGFYDGKFLGRPLSEYEPDEMSEELDGYDIKTIVCWSNDCKNYFAEDGDRYEQVPNADIAGFEIYRRKNHRYNPFLEGEGYVIADSEGIRCYRVRPEGGRVVLKYHAFEQLRIDGAGGVGRAPFGSDPVGFISVDDPPEYFRIVNNYYGVKK